MNDTQGPQEPPVVLSIESKRGCGYRKPAKDGVGLYLTAPAPGEDCERLSWPLTTCPCCGAGIKPARGWTWIKPASLFLPEQDPLCTCNNPQNSNLRHFRHCPICNPAVVVGPDIKAGLLWIGEKFYPHPLDFLREAQEMGISRKLAAIPQGFELGRTWVLLGHRNGILNPLELDVEPSWTPAIFSVFRPTGLDLVIDNPNQIPDKAKNIMNSHPGSRLVKVIRDTAAEDLLFDQDDE